MNSRTEGEQQKALLQEGDIIDIVEGHTVYADIPEHFAYGNRKGSFALTHHEAKIKGELAYLAGTYIVHKTVHEGGIQGASSGDYYPGGHHVFAERQDGMKVDFYQTGHFTAMIPDITPTGRAVRSWKKLVSE